MSKNDIIRAAIHFPVGVFAAWLGTWAAITCAVFAVGFMVYEALEDWRIEDQSFKDMFGFLCGLGAGAALFYFL